MTTTVAPAITPFRLFDVELARVERLCPSFRRLTLTGPELHRFADNGFDQRIKLLIPTTAPQARALGRLTGPDAVAADWYGAWRTLSDDERPALRTYTVRASRPRMREIDVDVVQHGDLGPASRWAGAARPGDRLVVCGPDAHHPGPHGGVDFAPPAHSRAVLMAGDETAVPAIASIIERLPRDARGEVLLEVPCTGDQLPIDRPTGITVTWLPRDGSGHGTRLVPAVQAAAARLLGSQGRPHDIHLDDVDVDQGLLWEVPVDADGGPLIATTELYAWLAGEAGVIKALRRHLVSERGIDRRSVAFMGYWRLGRAESA
ncbi:NADPH-dependent ferric siderophore reductase (plasmid) [Cellulomonas sp. WB94]|uniref:siderophore-interacting protein n=1 Tax=Cellulomonas sp. WB94 TaxID=2173174 RepID=UPI000D572704|nr:siderophore-interacting protein [Cellulomonas sp. WB94]PVU81468.1 NADPH-dependent ferric siderophore reductase [Cellulomonas sp. WB94]